MVLNGVATAGATGRELLESCPPVAAQALLGAELVIPGDRLRATITEVEAYGGTPDCPWPDPGAHTYNGQTTRNRAMFGPPGCFYIYRSYGIHSCANITCGPDGIPGGVLLRSVTVVDGREIAAERRGISVGKHTLSAGPGNVTQALGITIADYGMDLLDPESRVQLHNLERQAAVGISAGPRVGLQKASARPWRFWLAGQQVSTYRAHRHADGRS